MAVLIGDVAGKGVETAALSAMVRFFIEARSWDTLSPAEVLEQANAMLLGRLPRDAFVTAFLGHPLAATRSATATPATCRRCTSAEARLPARQPRPAARRARDGHALLESELKLEPGDLVFAHTDGLIEARQAGEMYGTERLAAARGRAARSHRRRSSCAPCTRT